MATMESKLVLSLVDRLSGPIKGAGNALDDLEAAAKSAGKSGSKEMQELGKSLKEARDQASKFDLFEKLRKDLPATRQAFRQAQGEVEKLARELDEARQAAAKFDGVKSFQKNGPIAREMADAKKKVQELERQLTTAQRTVSRTSDAFEKQAIAVKEAKKSLQGMGVDLKSVGSAQATLKSKIDNTTTALKRQIDTEARAAQRREKFARGYQVLAATGAGAVMAGQMLARPVGKAMTYDERVARMASTMAGGAPIEEKRAAKVKISDAIDNALKGGGGTRDGAATAMDTLLAAGEVLNDGEAFDLIGPVVKTAYASNTDEGAMAKLAIALRQNGVAAKDIQEGLDIAMKGGQLGGFELKDMAKALPSQLASLKAAGITGLPALKEIVGLNQAAMLTAGGADEAGNNVLNFLAKLTSSDLQTKMSKAVTPQVGDPTTPGKVTGKGKRRKVAPAEFDFQGYLIQRQKEGVNAIDAFGEILERQYAADPRYQQLKSEAGNVKDAGALEEFINSAMKISEGTALSKLLPDRQAWLAAFAAFANKDQRKELVGKLDNSSGTVQAESDFIREHPFSKKQDAANTLDRANENAYGALEGPMGALIEKVNDAARAFPTLTTGVYAAGELLAALAGAGVTGGVLYALLSKGKGPGVPPPAAAPAPGGSAPFSLAPKATLGGALKSGLKGGAVNAIVYAAGTTAIDAALGVTPEKAAEIDKNFSTGAILARLGDDLYNLVLGGGSKSAPMPERKPAEATDAAPNLPAAPLPPQHPMRAPMPPQSPTLDSITSEWPESARKSLADFVRAIAQGGIDAKAEATRVGEAIQQELSVTGTPKINTAELDIAISKAQQLGNALRNIPGVVAPSSGKPPEGRAKGGPVAGGTPYIVGERGPEMFVPRSSGSILTAARTADMFQPRSAPKRTGGGQSGNSGPASITFGDINIQGGANATPQQIRREFSREASAIMRRHFTDGIT